MWENPDQLGLQVLRLRMEEQTDSRAEEGEGKAVLPPQLWAGQQGGSHVESCWTGPQPRQNGVSRWRGCWLPGGGFSEASCKKLWKEQHGAKPAKSGKWEVATGSEEQLPVA